MTQTTWLICPTCRSKTRIKIRFDTIIEHLPLYCPKCKQEQLVNVNHFTITQIVEPDAVTQSQ